MRPVAMVLPSGEAGATIDSLGFQPPPGKVVVEPARIVSDEAQGLRALYVALTRPTQRLTVVHAAELPVALR